MIDLWHINAEQRDEAKTRAEGTSSLRNSITNGGSAIYGALGEILFRDYCLYIAGLDVIDQPSFDYDLIVSGRRIDVKTKKTSCAPRPEYNASVADFNTKQDCDYYVFVRISDDERFGWICGGIAKDEFYQRAAFNREGESDGDSGWAFRADCWNIPLEKLEAIQTLLNIDA